MTSPLFNHSLEKHIIIQLDGLFMREKLKNDLPGHLYVEHDTLLPAFENLKIGSDSPINLNEKNIIQINDCANNSIYLRIEEITKFLKKPLNPQYDDFYNSILIAEFSRELYENYLQPASPALLSPMPSPFSTRSSPVTISPSLAEMAAHDLSLESSVCFTDKSHMDKALKELFDLLKLDYLIDPNISDDPDNPYEDDSDVPGLSSAQIENIKSLIGNTIMIETAERLEKEFLGINIPSYQHSWAKGKTEIELHISLEDLQKKHRGAFIDPQGHCCLVLPTDFEGISDLDNAISPTILGAGSFKTFVPVFDLKLLKVKALGIHDVKKTPPEESLKQIEYRMQFREPLRQAIEKLTREYPSSKANDFPFFLPYAVLVFEHEGHKQVAELMEFGTDDFKQVVLGMTQAQRRKITPMFIEDALRIYTALEKLHLTSRDTKLENILQDINGNLALSDLDELILEEDLKQQTLEQGHMPVFGTLEYIHPALLRANLTFGRAIMQLWEAEAAETPEPKAQLKKLATDTIDRVLGELTSQKNQMWSVALCFYQCYTGGSFPLCIQTNIDKANEIKANCQKEIENLTAAWYDAHQDDPEVMDDPFHPAHKELEDSIQKLQDESKLNQTRLFSQMTNEDIEQEFQNTEGLPILSLVRKMLLGEFTSFEPILHQVVREKILLKKK